MRTCRPAPHGGRPIPHRSRATWRLVEAIDRGQVEVEPAAIHCSEETLRCNAPATAGLQLNRSTLDREPSDQRGVSLSRTGGSSHPLERKPKLGVGGHSDSWVLAWHLEESVARRSYSGKLPMRWYSLLVLPPPAAAKTRP